MSKKQKQEEKVVDIARERTLYRELGARYKELTILEQDLNKDISIEEIRSLISSKKSIIYDKMLSIERFIEKQ